MPRLETSSGWSRLRDDLADLVSPSTGSFSARASILKSVLLRSVRITLVNPSSSSPHPPLLPLRIRPAFVVLNILDLTLLGILGFHPRGQTWIRINDKILHFVCFFLATAMFYMIWDVDEPARASYLWRNASLILTGVTCFLVGGIGSEIVQSLLPYKEFQIGDIIANLLGSSLGLFFSYHLEKRHRARRELERLYAPLDIEDYGDLDDAEDEEFSPPPRRNNAPRSSLKQSGAGAGSGARNKKARFGNDIWDDSVDIQTYESRSSTKSVASGSKQPAAAAASDPLSEPASKPRKEDLFSIDNDDSDDDEAATGSTKVAPAEETNAWKQAD